MKVHVVDPGPTPSAVCLAVPALEDIAVLVTIPAFESEVTKDVVPFADAPDASETVVLTIGSGPGYIPGVIRTATVTIVEVPIVTLTASGAPAEVGPVPGTFTIARSGPMTAPLVVNLSIGGTATLGTDYLNSGWTSVTIPAGQPSVSKALTPVLDASDEGTETVILSIAAGAGYAAGGPGSATLSIADTPPTVTIVVSDSTASEAGSDPGSFTLTRTGSTAEELVVLVEWTGTADPFGDFTEFLTGFVTFPAGQASAVLTARPADDAVAEGTEALIGTVRQFFTPIVVGSPGTATVTVADND